MAGIQDLPEEILERIFSLGCEIPGTSEEMTALSNHGPLQRPPKNSTIPNPRIKPFAEVTSRVCKYWRDLVNRTPSLTFISWTIEDELESVFSLVEMCSALNRTIDLDITLLLPYKDALLTDAFAVLEANKARIRSIFMLWPSWRSKRHPEPYSAVIRAINNLVYLPNLEQFVFTFAPYYWFGGKVTIPPLTVKTPVMRHFSSRGRLAGFTKDDPTDPLAIGTDFSFSTSPFSAFRTLAKQLVWLDLRLCSGQTFRAEPDTPIDFPQLETLHLFYSNGTQAKAEALYRNANAPRLRELYLVYANKYGEVISDPFGKDSTVALGVIPCGARKRGIDKQEFVKYDRGLGTQLLIGWDQGGPAITPAKYLSTASLHNVSYLEFSLKADSRQSGGKALDLMARNLGGRLPGLRTVFLRNSGGRDFGEVRKPIPTVRILHISAMKDAKPQDFADLIRMFPNVEQLYLTETEGDQYVACVETLCHQSGGQQRKDVADRLASLLSLREEPDRTSLHLPHLEKLTLDCTYPNQAYFAKHFGPVVDHLSQLVKDRKLTPTPLKEVVMILKSIQFEIGSSPDLPGKDPNINNLTSPFSRRAFSQKPKDATFGRGLDETHFRVWCKDHGISYVKND